MVIWGSFFLISLTLVGGGFGVVFSWAYGLGLCLGGGVCW